MCLDWSVISYVSLILDSLKFLWLIVFDKLRTEGLHFSTDMMGLIYFRGGQLVVMGPIFGSFGS